MSVSASSSAFRPATIELVLRLPDGSPWRLGMSRGCERFIGAYPRLEGFRAEGPLLSYTVAGATGA